MIVLAVFEMLKHKILTSKLGFNAAHKHSPEHIFSILQVFSTLITLCYFLMELQLLVFTVVTNAVNRKYTYILSK